LLNVAKSAKRSFASKYLKLCLFDTKLRFALFALLRSAIFSETEVDNFFVTIPERVKSALKNDFRTKNI